jgi:hypothetical protein
MSCRCCCSSTPASGPRSGSSAYGAKPLASLAPSPSRSRAFCGIVPGAGVSRNGESSDSGESGRGDGAGGSNLAKRVRWGTRAGAGDTRFEVRAVGTEHEAHALVLRGEQRARVAGRVEREHAGPQRAQVARDLRGVRRRARARAGERLRALALEQERERLRRRRRQLRERVRRGHGRGGCRRLRAAARGKGAGVMIMSFSHHHHGRLVLSAYILHTSPLHA